MNPVKTMAAQPDIDTAIRIVMKRARMTYHIRNCILSDYSHHRKVTTDEVRARLIKMEKRGEVERIPHCPRSQPYRKQIAWKLTI